MKTINTYVTYWRCSTDDLPWRNFEKIDYSLRFSVAQRCMEQGYNTMFKISEDGKTLTIVIDDGNFRQS